MTGIKRHCRIKGRVRLKLTGPDGQVKHESLRLNNITALMDRHVADQMSDQGEGSIGYIGVGVGVGTEIPSQIGLDESLACVVLDSITQGSDENDNDVIYVATFGPRVGTGIISEAGLLKDDNNISLMAYLTGFAPINKQVADTLTVTWTVTFGAS
jgi:hypothetical protein